MSLEVDLDPEILVNGIKSIVARKPPKTKAPLIELVKKIEDENTVAIGVREIIDAFVNAGYNILDVYEFFKYTGIIQTDEDWVKLREDVERVIIASEVQKEAWGVTL